MAKREQLYIAHVCLNSRLEPIQKENKEQGLNRIQHPDFCERGFVDIDPSNHSQGEQCWKYCEQCEAKGYSVITKPPKKILSEAQKANIENMKKQRAIKGGYDMEQIIEDSYSEHY